MNDNVLKRFTDQATHHAGEHGRVGDVGATDDHGAFGWLRGFHDRSIMLELRKKNGNIKAIGYAWLERIEFDPSEGITLYVAGHQIKIKGRNLNTDLGDHVQLFQGITRHRVPWVQESDEPAALLAGKGATVVEEIEW